MPTGNQGFAPYLLRHLIDIAGQNTPELKVQIPGFLNMLVSDQPIPLSVKRADGTKRKVIVTYAQRFTECDTETTPSCDRTHVPTELEIEVTVSNYRQLAFHISDDTLAQYMEDATRTIAKGLPGTDMMNKFVQNLGRAANALLKSVDRDLLTIQVAEFGINNPYDSAAAQTINISKDGSIDPLTNGFTKILQDYQINQGNGRPQVVGSGLFHAFMLEQRAKSANQSGLNTAIQAAEMDFYYDQNTADIFGANQIGVFEKGAVQLVEYFRYGGFRAGKKPGASSFGIIPIPVQTIDGVREVEFDFQLRYNDCVETFTDAYYGSELTLEPGYNLILSKNFGLFTIPDDAYRTDCEELTGNKGSYRYVITNDCDDCA